MDDFYEMLYEQHQARALLESEKPQAGDTTQTFFSVQDFILYHEKTGPQDRTTRQDKTQPQDKTRQDKE